MQGRSLFSTPLVAVIALSIVLALTAQTPPPLSEAPRNPEFTTFVRDLQLGIAAPAVTPGDRGLGWRPHPLELWHLIGQAPPPLAPLPGSYDLRTYSKMTAVRNQGNCGSCWAFGTYGSMESILRTAETRDFSENNLKDLHGFDWSPCGGGNGGMSIAYLSRWSGPVEESADPYQPTNTNTSPAGLPPQKHVQNVLMGAVRASSTDNDTIKTFLMTYGALLASMRWEDTAYNAATAAYYYSGTADPNHGITIAGWDDNYSRFNFAATPPGNGAFLIKNSWGGSWGQNGYFWISYYDNRLARVNPVFAFTGNESTTNYVREYSYDPLGWVNSLGLGSPTAHFANIFTAAATENLSAVSFYATAANASYTIRVFTGVTAGAPTSGTLAGTASGASTYAGYYTVPLTTPVSIPAGTRFSVAVQMTTPGYNYPIPVEYAIAGFSSAATASPGQSFYSSSGSSWTDLTTWNATANVALKAFTSPPVTTTIQTTPTGLQITVDGTNYTAPASFHWTPGTTHTIATTSPQTATATSRWVWDAWSDTGAISHTITAPGVDATFTASFHLQYLLTMVAGVGGTVSPASGYRDVNMFYSIEAFPNPGYTFTGWTGTGTGSYTGTNNPWQVHMVSAITQTAAFAPIPTFQPIRVNAGGPAYYSPSGILWSADNGYSAGNTYGVSSAIRNTTDQCLYQCERWNSGPLTYTFTVPNGDYNVRLKFAEVYFTSAGQRIFHIDINGVRKVAGFDIVAVAGMSETAIDKVFPVTVTGGTITILLTPVTSNPKIAAIEITQAAVAVAMQPGAAIVFPGNTRQFLPTVVGSANTAVNWSLSPNLGTVDASGLYTAPASIASETRVKITATSQADPTQSASAAIVLSPFWSQADIGSVNAPGSVTLLPGSYRVYGSGDVFGNADAFHYLYQSMTGDGSIVARVRSTYSNVYTKAGVMMRETITPGSRHIFASVFQGSVGLLEARDSTSGNTTYEFGSGGLFWVRLERRGNTFTGYVSNDGDAWTVVGTPKTIAMANTIYVGFAVSSCFNPLVSAEFDNTAITGPVTVAVNEKLGSIVAGQTATFTARVLGAASTAVTWSVLPPGMGTINSGGTYTAPASIPTPAQITIQATSVADSTKSAIALLNLGAFQPIRVNAGGPSHIDPTGVFWNGDTNADSGSTFSNGTPVTGTPTPYLYQSEHFNNGTFQYKFFVPTGQYNVKLKFAEIWFTGTGQRVFNVIVNGMSILNNFDIVAQAGGAFKSLDRSIVLATGTNQIVIQFTPVVSAPKINAIEIYQ